MVETFNLPIGTLEYMDDSHTYIFDGIMLPSITQIISDKGKFEFVSEEVLEEAARKGTLMHKAIEDYEKYGVENELQELYNYKFLKRAVGFSVIESEIPVVLFKNGSPVAAGRLDQLIELDGKLGINDLKRTNNFDTQYVACQTTLYAQAYEDTYGKHIDFISGTHLREKVRSFYKLLPAKELVEKKLNDFLSNN